MLGAFPSPFPVNEERSGHRILRLAFLPLLLLVCFARESFAAPPDERISQYGHTVWRIQDGYFGGTVSAITQTTDGYIWVGTGAGIFKFDGVRFVRWSEQSGEQPVLSRVLRLVSARDGSLWIGTESGLAHIVNNRLILHQKNEGWLINSIMEGRDGKIWITRMRPDDKTHSFCQVLDAEVRCYGSNEGVDVYGAGPVVQDSSGDLWVGSHRTLVKWHSGATRVYRPQALQSNEADGVVALLPAKDGSLWVGIGLAARGAGLERVVDGVLTPFLVPKLNGETLEVTTLCSDHQNHVWVGTTRGLYRIRGTDVDHYGSTEGLSSDFVQQIFEDREGNVWVATPQGLDMFRELPVKSISKREGLNEDSVEAVAAARDGSVWIGTSRLQVLGPNGVSFGPGKQLPGDQATSLFEDRAGRLWAGMNNKLFVREGEGFRQITKQDGTALGMVMGITEDVEHNIWVETAGSPGTLLRIEGLQVRQAFPTPQVPLARKIAADPQGGIWLGLVTGDLARFRGGQVDVFTFGDHPRSRVLAITAGPDGSILGATEFGVVAWKDGRQGMLTVRNNLPCNSVTGLIFDQQSNLWLYAQCGLIDIPSQQIKLWWEHPDSKLSLRVFDTLDGVRPGLAHFNSSTKTPDGRLWFANGNVVQVIDPAHSPENTWPPPVVISAVVADRKSYPLGTVIRLPALTRDLEIDYSALSYVAPQKVLFRYMLEGHDAGWQEPGTRRQAFFNNLRPRPYRFRVLARNNDGLWSEAGASLNFTILPAYYQTNWFRALCVAAFVALLWALYELRLRAIQRQFNVGMEERLKERTRIARELHDTLLQNLHGLLFRFQAARNMLPRRPEEAMEALDGAISRTEQAITESQDAITDLRPGTTTENDLGEQVRAAGKELEAAANSNGAPPSFSVIVEGERKTLSPMLQAEVYRIAHELLRNSFRHACARRVEAEVRYGDDQLRVRIRDDGKGMDPEVLKKGKRRGHWGILGAKERAKQIGAQLDFWSEPGAGTEVQLIIPAAIAYKNSRDRPRFRFLRRVKVDD